MPAILIRVAEADALTIALHGRYAIERELGAGGMATVYLARDLQHDRLVALKAILPEIASDMGADRFRREIRLVAQLHHPHIVPPALGMDLG
jgi:serine/threonine-protein kinase